MHETAVLSEVVNIVVTAAKNNEIEKITKVVLRIGEFSCIQEDQLMFSYDIITQNTILEGSNLVIEWVQAMAYCNNCNKTFPISFTHKECPTCHKFSEEIVSGYETHVYNIEGE
ncbi:hydrogenase maturation nickel metallochaperone HypA [Clostridium uliginosum]|uniref:Hydrogenase maturation factor HypA n=1 Tax=Clostridium uliginosum TaxID=119641 RepID=A0A1I1JQW7_9CLOT|nr:hydrogenase maturation nickel metallochaperone HypA [Clostridium uliginosum]SFC50332.1 hydrogenase nickel incorporation protein HypA/HybF [Clostridium uliginosum]